MPVVRILGGGLHRPTEDNDHRYGLKDYALTYSGLFVIENALAYNSDNLGDVAIAPLGGPAQASPAPGSTATGDGPGGLIPLLMISPLGLIALYRRRRLV